MIPDGFTDALDLGDISYDDVVDYSDTAAEDSYTDDGE